MPVLAGEAEWALEVLELLLILLCSTKNFKKKKSKIRCKTCKYY